jgi:hypothetical protein
MQAMELAGVMLTTTDTTTPSTMIVRMSQELPSRTGKDVRTKTVMDIPTRILRGGWPMVPMPSWLKHLNGTIPTVTDTGTISEEACQIIAQMNLEHHGKIQPTDALILTKMVGPIFKTVILTNKHSGLMLMVTDTEITPVVSSQMLV